jgi:hypothetical protein
MGARDRRIQALDADAGDAADLHRESIEHGQTPLQVELARSHLIYGWSRPRMSDEVKPVISSRLHMMP